jgi:hypothetical protein
MALLRHRGASTDHPTDHPTDRGADHDLDRRAHRPEHRADVRPEVGPDPRHHEEARDRFGGTNVGAVFFGWLVAIGLTILLTSVVGAVVAAVGSNTSVTQSDAERSAGTIGLAAAITLVVVLAVAYYAGGYVAGRMSRYDGGRQGFGVWGLGLLVTVVAIGLGAVFGTQYNLLDRVDLPRLPLSTDDLGLGGLVTAAVVLLVTLLAAVVGGKAGIRYHAKVDRVAYTR